MQNLHKIRIQNEAEVTKVFVDGQEIHGLQEISFEHKAGKLPRVTLGIYPQCVELNGLAYIDVNADLERCLDQLLSLKKETEEERTAQKVREAQKLQECTSWNNAETI